MSADVLRALADAVAVSRDALVVARRHNTDLLDQEKP